MLSHYQDLSGVSFFLFDDLFASDKLINIAGISLNIMPLVMTVINLLSAYIYTTNLKKKDKIQLWSLAIVFLVLLYDSPVGLVLYWTLNNVFSLFKNVIYKNINIFKIPYKFKYFVSCLYNNTYVIKNKYMVYMIVFCLFMFIYSILGYLIDAQFYIKADSSQLLQYYPRLAVIFIGILFVIYCYNLKNYWRFNKINVLKFIPALLLFIGILVHVVLLIKLYLFDVINSNLRYHHISWLFIRNLLTGLSIFMFIYGLSILKSVYIFFYDGLSKIKNINSIFILSVASVLTLVFWYFPNTLVSIDNDAFYFTKNSIFKTLITWGFIYFYGFLFVFYLLFRPLKIIISMVSLCLLFIFLIYGFILKGSYGILLGLSLSNSNNLYSSYGFLIDIIIFIAIFMFVFKLLKSKYINITISALSVLLVALIFSGSVSYNSIQYGDKSNNITNNMNNDKGNNLFDISYGTLNFSKIKHNIVVFMIDGFTSGMMEGIMQDRSDLIKQLNGFTYYGNSASVGANTYTGLIGIIGGLNNTALKINKMQLPSISNYYDKKYNDLSKFFHHDHGYEVSFVSPQFWGRTCKVNPYVDFCRSQYLGREPEFDHYWGLYKKTLKNIKHSSIKSNSELLLTVLSMFKVVNYDFRKNFYMNGLWLGYAGNTSSLHSKQASGVLVALPYIAKTTAVKPTFKLIQTQITHPPYGINPETCLADSNYDKFYSKFTQKTYSQRYYSSICAIKHIVRFGHWLKKNKIYNNTKIILVSDHGLGSNYRLKKIYKKTDDDINSLLMVKNFNDNKKFKVNNKILVTNADTMGIACDGLVGCQKLYGKNITKNPIGNRTIIYSGRALRSKKIDNFEVFPVMNSFKVKNNIWDFNNWSRLNLNNRYQLLK